MDGAILRDVGTEVGKSLVEAVKAASFGGPVVVAGEPPGSVRKGWGEGGDEVRPGLVGGFRHVHLGGDVDDVRA